MTRRTAPSEPVRATKMGRRPAPPAVRFWPKVDLNGPVPSYAPHLGNCWIWKGAKTTYPSGQYGRFRGANSRMLPAHRWSYEDANGATNADALDHLCRTTLCVRPDHL